MTETSPHPVQNVRFIRVDENNIVIETQGITDIGALLEMQKRADGYIVIPVGIEYPAIGDTINVQPTTGGP